MDKEQEILATLADLKQGQDNLAAHIDNVAKGLAAHIGARIDALDDRVGYVERLLRARDAFPPPIKRPKSFQAATELHSVSASVRRRLGQLG